MLLELSGDRPDRRLIGAVVTEENVKHETVAIEQRQARESSEEAKSFLPNCGMLLETASIDCRQLY